MKTEQTDFIWKIEKKGDIFKNKWKMGWMKWSVDGLEQLSTRGPCGGCHLQFRCTMRSNSCGCYFHRFVRTSRGNPRMLDAANEQLKGRIICGRRWRNSQPLDTWTVDGSLTNPQNANLILFYSTAPPIIHSTGPCPSPLISCRQIIII